MKSDDNRYKPNLIDSFEPQKSGMEVVNMSVPTAADIKKKSLSQHLWDPDTRLKLGLLNAGLLATQCETNIPGTRPGGAWANPVRNCISEGSAVLRRPATKLSTATDFLQVYFFPARGLIPVTVILL